MSSDDKVAKIHQAELAEAQFEAENAKAHHDNLMKKSYLHPPAASKRMDQYRAKHGNDALYEKLEGNARKTAFGRRPGSILDKDGYTPGAGDRRQESHIARQGLPQAVKGLHESRDRYNAAKTASQTIEERNAQKRLELRQQREKAREKEARDREERRNREAGRSTERTSERDHGIDDDFGDDR